MGSSRVLILLWYKWLKCLSDRNVSAKNVRNVSLKKTTLQKPKSVCIANNSDTLQHVKNFKCYLGLVFMSDERKTKEIDTWVGKANAVLLKFYCSLVTKRELLCTEKLSVHQNMF